jgi:hypothetical protein
MEIIFLGFWFSVVAWIVCAVWIAISWAQEVSQRRKGKPVKPGSAAPWLILGFLTLALGLIVMLARDFSRGFWK